MALTDFSKNLNYMARKDVVTEQNEKQVLDEFWDVFAKWFNSQDKPREDGETKTVIKFRGINLPIYIRYGEIGELTEFGLDYNTEPPNPYDTDEEMDEFARRVDADDFRTRRN